MQVDFLEWMNLLREEYLKDFIKQGGAAVKFSVSSSPELAERLKRDIAAEAERESYLVAQVDASVVRVHLMQELFHEIARQIPWEDLARRVVARCYQNEGFEVSGPDLRVDSVADQNGVIPGPLRMQIRRSLEGLLYRSHDLARDFRYAMLWMCMAQITRLEGGGPDVELIEQWLTGNLRLISGVKRLLIFEKIGRHNARAMLSSLGAWMRLAGHPGFLFILDIRQLAIAKRQDIGNGTLHYTVAAAMDAYEVIRQLIDSTDDLSGFLSVVLAPPELFEDEKRGVKAYKALYERIWPDVRLKSRANPLSALTSLVAVGATL
ncbi:MAG: BREX system ATP-binding domain-containing protein [Vulcanimicrobiota bacterium]